MVCNKLELTWVTASIVWVRYNPYVNRWLRHDCIKHAWGNFISQVCWLCVKNELCLRYGSIKWLMSHSPFFMKNISLVTECVSCNVLTSLFKCVPVCKLVHVVTLLHVNVLFDTFWYYTMGPQNCNLLTRMTAQLKIHVVDCSSFKGCTGVCVCVKKEQVIQMCSPASASPDRDAIFQLGRM